MGKSTSTDTRAPKTRIKASTLKGALDDVIDMVEARSTIPILSHVLLRAVDQRIELTATDLDCQAYRDCTSDDRDGPDSRAWLDAIRSFAVMLPAKPLKAILAELDGDAMVTIEAPAGVTDKWSGRVTLRAGRARFQLNALPVGDFPVLGGFDVHSDFMLPCSAMADALAMVEHAISTEETRYYLNGVYLHPDGLELRLAATDGHRLARRTLDGPDGAASFPAVIIGRKAVGILDKLLASAVKAADKDGTPPTVLIEANADGTRLRFAMAAADGGEVELIAKAIDGTYPDYVRVIPIDAPNRATIAKGELADAIKRAAVLVSDKTQTVKAVFADDTLTLSGGSAEIGDASEELPCLYAGPPVTLGLNSKYWRQALAAIASDTVAMQFFDDGLAAVRVSGWENEAEAGALVQVLMPVRV